MVCFSQIFSFPFVQRCVFSALSFLLDIVCSPYERYQLTDFARFQELTYNVDEIDSTVLESFITTYILFLLLVRMNTDDKLLHISKAELTQAMKS
jgi:hypothetical protein